ncbi:MAG: hypothetical protein H6R26_546 [Proteobacteria bacterium]|nr:hypothetical protein [Pseudomonadota bacterium]
MRMTRLTLLIACLLSPIAALAGPEMLLVCYPGGPVSAKDANGAMSSMLRVVERVGGWQADSFASLFTTKLDECRKQMVEKHPKFAISSLGLYLELRATHHLMPLIQPRIKGRTSEKYRIIVQKDRFKTLEELRGKTLGGTVLEEEAFVGRIVLAGKYDPASFFSLKPTNQAIRALRSLDKGELDAVILNEQQYAGLASLTMQSPVEAIFTSEEIPLMGVVANSDKTTAEERARFAKALEGMCADAEGKKLCDLFGIDAFAAVQPAVFAPMAKLWGGK